MATSIIKLDTQLASQPKEVLFCRTCVVSNQRPRIKFDETGRCSACIFREYEQTQVDWAERERELQDWAAELRTRPGIHAIIASSGGKDSGYIAHVLKHELGLNVLSATFKPFLYTDIGLKNFEAYVDSGFETLQAHPNGRFQRKLARMCFETLADGWAGFGMGQMAYPHWLAHQLNVPYVIYSENGEGQYSGDPEVFNLRGMASGLWAEKYHKGRTIDDLVNFGLAYGYLDRKDFTESSLAWYRPPPVSSKVEMLWMSYFRYYDPMEAFYSATEHTGFTPNEERSEGTYSKYASLDDKTDGFHFYLAFIKFGIGRATSDAAHEIRDGQLTREEGVALVHRYDGEFPKRHFPEFMEYLDITEERFWEVCDFWRPEHLWARDGDQWYLKQQVT